MPNLIYTTYLTKRIGFHQHDSTHGGRGGALPDQYNLIQKWYESVKNICNKNVHAVIFHNECTQPFIEKYSNDFISFVKWEKTHRQSYNDERFWAFNEYLTLHDYEYALSTDMFDVEILKNPFEIMNSHNLYCGFEKKNVPGSYGWKWVNTKMRRYHFGMIPKTDCIYNAGICGGSKKYLLAFYKVMIDIFKTTTNKENTNMAVFNYALRKVKAKGWKIFTGFPLHNVFESHKVVKGTYIKHK